MTRNGRRVDAVAQTTKHGFVFVFDRANGTPLFPIEERRFPASAVDGERAARHAADPDEAGAVCAAAPDRRAADQSHAGGAQGGARGVPRVSQRRSVRAARASARRPSSSPGSTAARSGAAPHSIRRAGCCTSTRTRWPGPAAWRRTRLRPAAGSVYLSNCASCHRDELEGAPPQIPSLVGIGQRRSPDELRTVISEGRGPHGRLPGPAAGCGDRARRVPADRRRRSGRARHGGDRHEIPVHRLPEVSRSRRLPGDRAALGDVERDRPEHGRVRVEGSARRISGARRRRD